MSTVLRTAISRGHAADRSGHRANVGDADGGGSESIKRYKDKGAWHNGSFAIWLKRNNLGQAWRDATGGQRKPRGGHAALSQSAPRKQKSWRWMLSSGYAMMIRGITVGHREPELDSRWDQFGKTNNHCSKRVGMRSCIVRNLQPEWLPIKTTPLPIRKEVCCLASYFVLGYRRERCD